MLTPHPGEMARLCGITIDDVQADRIGVAAAAARTWKATVVLKGARTVVADPDGLGYFRSRPWMVRYAGNEEEGYRLSAAVRIQQNIIGLDVTAVTNQPGVDVSASGRMAPGCRGCHYDPYFGLDKVAKILSKRSGTGASMTWNS